MGKSQAIEPMRPLSIGVLVEAKLNVEYVDAVFNCKRVDEAHSLAGLPPIPTLPELSIRIRSVYVSEPIAPV